MELITEKKLFKISNIDPKTDLPSFPVDFDLVNTYTVYIVKGLLTGFDVLCIFLAILFASFLYRHNLLFRDRHHILLLILTKFKRINQLLIP